MNYRIFIPSFRFDRNLVIDLMKLGFDSIDVKSVYGMPKKETRKHDSIVIYSNGLGKEYFREVASKSNITELSMIQIAETLNNMLVILQDNRRKNENFLNYAELQGAEIFQSNFPRIDRKTIVTDGKMIVIKNGNNENDFIEIEKTIKKYTHEFCYSTDYVYVGKTKSIPVIH